MSINEILPDINEKYLFCKNLFNQGFPERVVSILSTLIDNVSLTQIKNRGVKNANLDKIHNLRGKAYLKMNQFEKSIVDFTKAIKMNCMNANYYNNRGLSFDALKKYYKAIEDYSQAIYYNNKDPIYYYNRGVGYQNCKMYQEAINDLDQAIFKDKKNPVYFEARGSMLHSIGDYKKSTVDFQEAKKLKEKTNYSIKTQKIMEKSLLEKAIESIEYEKYEEAISLLSNACTINPNEAEYNFLIGKCKLKKGKKKEAIENFTTAIKLNSTRSLYFIRRADCYSKKSQIHKSIEDITNAIELEKNNKDTSSDFYLLYIKRGNAYLRLKKHKKAILDFRKSLEYNKNPELYFKLGKCFFQIKKYEKAIQCFKNCYLLSISTFNFDQTKNLTSLKLSQFGKSIAQFNQIYESTTTSVEKITTELSTRDIKIQKSLNFLKKKRTEQYFSNTKHIKSMIYWKRRLEKSPPFRLIEDTKFGFFPNIKISSTIARLIEPLKKLENFIQYFRGFIEHGEKMITTNKKFQFSSTINSRITEFLDDFSWLSNDFILSMKEKKGVHKVFAKGLYYFANFHIFFTMNNQIINFLRKTWQEVRCYMHNFSIYCEKCCSTTSKSEFNELKMMMIENLDILETFDQKSRKISRIERMFHFKMKDFRISLNHRDNLIDLIAKENEVCINFQKIMKIGEELSVCTTSKLEFFENENQEIQRKLETFFHLVHEIKRDCPFRYYIVEINHYLGEHEYFEELESLLQWFKRSYGNKEIANIIKLGNRKSIVLNSYQILELSGKWQKNKFVYVIKKKGKKKHDNLSALECVVCYDKRRDTLILPCKHFFTCSTCTKKLKQCPICNSSIINTIDNIYC